jgi:hypothetical protein
MLIYIHIATPIEMIETFSLFLIVQYVHHDLTFRFACVRFVSQKREAGDATFCLRKDGIFFPFLTKKPGTVLLSNVDWLRTAFMMLPIVDGGLVASNAPLRWHRELISKFIL